MSDNSIAGQLSALARMTPTELRQRYAEVFGEPSRSGHKQWLVKRIAWRIQALAEGGLSERALRRAEELARDADLRVRPPQRFAPHQLASNSNETMVTIDVPPVRDARLPLPGATISRIYRGKRILVSVLPNGRGFEYEGQRFRSLSAVAKAVTGTHWNGPLFFGLNAPPKENAA